MKNLAIVFLILTILSCIKEEDETEAPIIGAQNVSLLVAPIQTDVNFLSTEKEHYVVRNNQSRR